MTSRVCSLSGHQWIMERISTYSHISTEHYFRKMALEVQMDFKGRGNIQCGWKRRWWQRLLGWIKTSKIHNRRILATKTIANCWCSKNMNMALHEKQKAIKCHKNILGEHFSFINSTGNFARNRFHGKLIKLSVTKKKLYLHVRTGLRKQKIGVYKIFTFFANAKLKFSLSNC